MGLATSNWPAKWSGRALLGAWLADVQKLLDMGERPDADPALADLERTTMKSTARRLLEDYYLFMRNGQGPLQSKRLDHSIACKIDEALHASRVALHHFAEARWGRAFVVAVTGSDVRYPRLG
jgi:hypothetical protein